MANTQGDIRFRVGLQTDQQSFNKLKQSLQGLQKIKPMDFKGSRQELSDVKDMAKEVEFALNKAFNPQLGTINISTFNRQIGLSKQKVEQIYSAFSKAGGQGQVAFNRLTSSVLTTNIQLKESKSLLTEMGTTMMNTIKWGVASSVMNTFTGSVKQAFQYVKSLQGSLTDIRIVTGDSTEQMERFATAANRSAQALGRSTLDYTKASLTFYQQGLDDETVQARTEAVMKAQNITGAGSEMADYLTSVWNGYKVANEEAELYVDKLAAVADTSASNMSQLAIAMSKVSATANVMGVSVDQLAAQIATVVATTRLAPESVGTAFKTIYARLNDIKTGSDEAEISLGNYSGKMASLGINVLDATGKLRDTGQVMEQIGSKWSTMTREQQMYLAATMGGQRQITQVTALFDNWGKYTDLLNISLQSQGTLVEKNSRYMESLEAKMEQLGAAGERVKDALIDTETVKGLVEALTNVTNLVGNLFETMGSGGNVLLAFGSALTQLFSGTISKQITNIVTNMNNAKYNLALLKAEIETTKMIQEANPGRRNEIAEDMEQIQKYYSVMDQASINNYKNLVAEKAEVQNKIILLQEQRNKISDISERVNQAKLETKDWEEAFKEIQNNKMQNVGSAIDHLKDSARDLKDLIASDLFADFDDSLTTVTEFKNAFERFKRSYETIDPEKAKQLAQAFSRFQSGAMTGGAFETKIREILQNATQEANNLRNAFDNGYASSQQLKSSAQGLNLVLKSSAESAKIAFDVNNSVKMVGAIGQISSAFITIKNLGSIIEDRDISAAEKMAKILTTAGFVIPTLLKSVNNIKDVLGITAVLQGKTLKYQELKNIAKQKQVLEQEKLLLLKKEENALITNEQLTRLYQIDDELEELGRNANKVKGEMGNFSDKMKSSFAAASSSVSGFVSSLAPLVPYIAVIAAVVATGYSIYRAYNQASIAAEKATKSAQDAKKKYDELKDSFKNLTSTLEDYHNAKDALSELTSGTEQWYDKVNQLNDKVLELLQNYPELAEYISSTESGLLQISKQGEDFIKNQARQRTYTAGMAYADLQQKSYQANRESKITDEGRRIYGGLGLFGGKDTLDTVIRAVNENGKSILGDREKLEEIVGKDYVDATIENTDAILNLINSLDIEKNQVDHLTDSIIKTNLLNQKQYQQSQNKDAFSDMYANFINLASSKLSKDFYKTQTGPYNNQYQVLDRQKVIDTYEKLAGTKIKQNWRGKLSEVDKNGNQQDKDFEAIEAYVRASEANIDAAKALEEVTERMTQAEKDFANADERTKDLVFNKGLAGGFDNVNVSEFSERDVNTLGNHISELANFLGMEEKDVSDNINNLKTSVQEKTKDFIDGIENNYVKVNINELFKKHETDFSENLAKILSQQIQDGYTKANGSKSIIKFYEGIKGESLQAVSNIVSNYNYASGSVEDFTQKLQQAGVETKDLTNQIENLYNTQKKIQNITTQENRINPNKVTEGSNTAGLMQKAANGQKLSSKQIEAMESGINNLLQLYPQLNKEVEILSNTQLAGTASYDEALRKLKASLFASYQDMDLDKSIVAQQIKTYVSSSEDLQNIREKQIVTDEDYSKLLIQIASKYQNCKNEIQKYTLALQGNNTKLQESTRLNLDISLRSGELAEQYGIEANSIQELSRYYQELWQKKGSHREDIADDAELLTEAAVSYIRLNRAIEDLQKSYTDVNTVLDTLQKYDITEILGDQDLSKTFSKLKTNVADLLNVSEDLVDSNFIKKYSKQLKSIIDGADNAEQALAELQKGMAALSTQNLDLPNGQFEIKVKDENLKDIIINDKQMLEDWLLNIPEGQINVNDLNAINSLISLMQQAGMSAQQIDDYFQAHNIDLNFENAYDGLNQIEQAAAKVGQAAAQAAGVSVEAKQQNIPKESQSVVQDGYWDEETAQVSYPTFEASSVGDAGGLAVHVGNRVRSLVVGQRWIPKPSVETTSASEQVTALRATSGNKKSFGGDISKKNSSGGNKKGGSGGGKGKGGKKGSTKKATKLDKVESKYDRYHDVNKSIERINRDLGKVQQKQSELTGKDLLKNLDKQIDLLKQQIKLYEQKLELQKGERDELQGKIKDLYGQLKAKGSVEFDQNGDLKNYQAFVENLTDAMNAKIDWYNKLSASNQEKKKEEFEEYKQKYQKIFEQFERYEELIDEQMPELMDQIQQALNEQIELRLQKFKLRVDLELDLSQAERDFNEFKRKVIDKLKDDDVLGNVKADFVDLTTYYKNGLDVIDALTDHVNATMKQLALMDKGESSDVYGTNRAQAIEDLRNYAKQLMDNLGDIEDLVDKIKESIFDTIDATDEAFEKQKDIFEFISDQIDHDKSMVGLLYGDKAYEQMSKYYDLQNENNQKQLDFLRQQKDMWYQRMVLEAQKMAAADPTSEIYKDAEKRFEAYKQKWMEGISQLNDALEDSIQTVIDKYANAIDNIFYKTELKGSGGRGLETIGEEWQLINNYADMYLDKINGMYEIEKLRYAYQDAIKDNANNLSAQKSLNNMMKEQLAYLESKDKLSQYDVDRANLLLQIEVKRLAVEQARNSKTKLRLRRDSQGNYTYQYTADETDVAQAERDLADARNELWNLTKAGYIDNLDQMQSYYNDWQEAVKKILTDTTKTTEQKEAELTRFHEIYSNLLNDLRNDNIQLREYLPGDAIYDLSALTSSNASKLMNDLMDDASLINEILPQTISGLQEFFDTADAQGGFKQFLDTPVQEAKQSLQQYQAELQVLSNVANQNFADYQQGYDLVIAQSEQFLKNNQDLINAYNDELNAVQSVIDAAYELVAAYNAAEQAAIDAATAANYYFQADLSNSAAAAPNPVSGRTEATLQEQATVQTVAKEMFETMVTNWNNRTSEYEAISKKWIQDLLAVTQNEGLSQEEMESQLYEINKQYFGGQNGSFINQKAAAPAVSYDNPVADIPIDNIDYLNDPNQIISTLLSALSNIQANTAMTNALSTLGLQGVQNSGTINQNVHIDASFPNVADRYEIEAAFANLVNMASQYAYRD